MKLFMRIVFAAIPALFAALFMVACGAPVSICWFTFIAGCFFGWVITKPRRDRGES